MRAGISAGGIGRRGRPTRQRFKLRRGSSNSIHDRRVDEVKTSLKLSPQPRQSLAADLATAFSGYAEGVPEFVERLFDEAIE